MSGRAVSSSGLTIQGEPDGEQQQVERFVDIILLTLVHGTIASLVLLLICFFTGYPHWLSTLLFKLTLSLPVNHT